MMTNLLEASLILAVVTFVYAGWALLIWPTKVEPFSRFRLLAEELKERAEARDRLLSASASLDYELNGQEEEEEEREEEKKR